MTVFNQGSRALTAVAAVLLAGGALPAQAHTRAFVSVAVGTPGYVVPQPVVVAAPQPVLVAPPRRVYVEEPRPVYVRAPQRVIVETPPPLYVTAPRRVVVRHVAAKPAHRAVRAQVHTVSRPVYRRVVTQRDVLVAGAARPILVSAQPQIVTRYHHVRRPAPLFCDAYGYCSRRAPVVIAPAPVIYRDRVIVHEGYGGYRHGYWRGRHHGDRGYGERGYGDRGYGDRGYEDRGYEDRGHGERHRGGYDGYRR
jgi:hypothetical protein